MSQASFWDMLQAVSRRHGQQTEAPAGPAIKLGTLSADPTKPFILQGEGVTRHRVLYGLTGSGKSKFIALLCTLLLQNGIPFACVDPHTDLADDLLSILIRTGFYQHPAAFSRLWYITFADEKGRYPP